MRHSPPVQFISDSVQESVKNLPFMGGAIQEEFKSLTGSVRRLAVPSVGAVFEELGFTYMGPVDGHDITELINTFNAAHKSWRTCNGPCSDNKGKRLSIC